ncbi:MAG TPA: serine--tRNA ligase, partial [Spirochaetota bacterium]|nr:serine--tRNA ligase [Spirochaetota bacterium]
MIDPKVLRENPDEIKRVLKIRKMESAVDLTALSELDSKMLSLGKECDVLRESRNKLSKEVGNIKREGSDASAVMNQVNEVNSKIEKNEAEIAALNDRYNEMILSVPNILHSSVPVGNDEKDNVIVRVHGEKPAFDFTPKAHYDLGTDLDILDFERGVKLSGARFYVYKNLAAKLERAILSFMLDLHT